MTARRPGALRLPAVFLLFVLTVGAGPALPPYRRADWPHWARTTGCWTVRTEVLMRDSEAPVLWRDERQCEIAWGRWRDPYTGALVQDPLKIAVDHTIALKWAHEHGGWRWPAERKRQYANWGPNLRATTGEVNRQKGSKGPAEWRPPRREAWCRYARDAAVTIVAHGLEPSPADRQAIREMTETCRDGRTPEQKHRDPETAY